MTELRQRKLYTDLSDSDESSRERDLHESTRRQSIPGSWSIGTIIYPGLAVLSIYGLYLLSTSTLFESSSSSSSKLPLSLSKFRPGDGIDPQPPIGEIWGHGDFEDGRKRSCKREFLEPESEGAYWVNVMHGNGGPEPNLSGGMIPSISSPFGMTRWSPQTRENYVSMCPYNQTDTRLHGFIGTHQPAIWMGESGPAQISAGLGDVITDFDRRGLPFRKEDEYASINYYRSVLDVGEKGSIEAELTATSRVGHMRYTFSPVNGAAPHIVLQASRESWYLHGDQPDDKVRFYPLGHVEVDVERREVAGWNDERQDSILLAEELPATNFKGYFVARFSKPFTDYGISHHGVLQPGVTTGDGQVLAGWVTFDEDTEVVEVTVGVSFISIDQARRNIDHETPSGQSFETTSQLTRKAWVDKLDMLSVKGATPSNLTVLYSSFAHTLVYPYEIHENISPPQSPSTPPEYAYYSGYLDKVVLGLSYSGYSIWDTFRAQTAWLLLVAPERVGSMIASMIQDYEQGGWLPMWKNIVETNIMVGTHADSIIAQAMRAGVTDFDWSKAWEAVRKNAFVPPDRDTELKFGDREEGTPQEVRAGLTEYIKLGYVAADLHAESGSRTLDYAYDDHAASIVASILGHQVDAKHLSNRSKNYKELWNDRTGHMEARNSDGSFAGETVGWTEGDHWAYSLDVMHDVPGLIELMGGNEPFIDFLNRHFDQGHNLHTNEPSHHIPYMYAMADAAHKTQEWVRRIGEMEFNHTAGGMSGNEDCGQMSAWYLFSAMGLYPVDPANTTYILGSPYFDSLTFTPPQSNRPLRVIAQGASAGNPYVRKLKIDNDDWNRVDITHQMILDGGTWEWELEGTEQAWPLP